MKSSQKFKSREALFYVREPKKHRPKPHHAQATSLKPSPSQTSEGAGRSVLPKVATTLPVVAALWLFGVTHSTRRNKAVTTWLPMSKPLAPFPSASQAVWLGLGLSSSYGRGAVWGGVFWGSL
ncbi:hypothetical protein ABN30_02065 [Haemophilus influenzae]|nr:hypothetical protein ABN30_02065 [Haemophilus influenzae]